MEERILFVDDEPNILDGYKRQLRKQFNLETAEGSEKGLDIVKNNEPFAVIVSDLKMPGMDGNMFLSRVKEISPESTRILLTGYADLSSAITAINDGSIFRLLTKPCDKQDLIAALENGIEQYRKNIRAGAEGRSSGVAAKKKVLIVDDDPVIVKLLERTLSSVDGVDVISAENGKKAIKLLMENNVDLLVSDLHMPELNGLQLLNYVRKNFKSLPAIVLTGWGTLKIEERIKAVGNYPYYEKPMDLNVFKEIVLEQLNAIPSSQIHGINISSFLQLIDIEGKDCTLTVSTDNSIGYLYFLNGMLIAAETGAERGEAAAQTIINWEDSVLEISNVCNRKKREVEKPLMKILMDCARIKDEEQAEAEEVEEIICPE